MQPSLKSWLNRKPSQKKPKKALKRGKLRGMSAKRIREARIYTNRRRAFLRAHPFCDAWRTIINKAPVSTLVFGGHDGFPHQPPPATEVHHVKRRGKFYLDETTWLACSTWSHRWIHAHPKEARQLGLLA